MIIVNLKGGMGNQMFQYSLGLYLSMKYNVPLKLDVRSLLNRDMDSQITFRDYQLDVFGIDLDRPTNFELWKFGMGISNEKYRNRFLSILDRISPKVYKEQGFSFNNKVNEIGSDIYLDGYWQSEKYFYNIAPLIRQKFNVVTSHSQSTNDLADLISSQTSVCVNVRRTDYINNSLHQTTDVEYYIAALKVLRSRINDELNIYIFSDDAQWCEENLFLSKNQVIVDDKFSGFKFSSKFWLMMNCKHFIIPNSSFAWWAAWLSTYENKVVIGPRKWLGDSKINTSDIWPAGWISI